MATQRMYSTRPEVGIGAGRATPVIIATDGRSQSDSAIQMGMLLAESEDAARIVTALRMTPIIPDAMPAVNVNLEAARRAEFKREVVDQTTRLLDTPADVQLAEGDPAVVVSKLAHQEHATMIVCGLGRHRVRDRVFGDETALRLVRVADVPVLAVATGLHFAPVRIVVAVDFSETSLRAARIALRLAAPGATIHLVHVAPREESVYDAAGWGTAYKQDAGDALHKTQERLSAPKSMIVQTVLLHGDPATELLAFAASVNAELIATGNHGHGFVARMLIGSVTTRIVRCSTCSVLTVPHAVVVMRARADVEPTAATAVPHHEWVAQLDDFTRRNTGRRGVLEVDDPEIGAQAQELDYPLLGATYDIHDERVELMFGEPGKTRGHLTRGIGGVTAIDLLRDESGRDVAIRIAHGAGQTLLTFSP